MQKGYIIEGDTIVIQKKLTELDEFVKKFLEVVKNILII